MAFRNVPISPRPGPLSLLISATAIYVRLFSKVWAVASDMGGWFVLGFMVSILPFGMS